MSRITRQVIAAVLGFVLVCECLTGAGFPSQAAAQDEMTKVEIVEQVGPAVVSVYSGTTEPGMGEEARVQESGTGFIVSEDGYIVIN